MAQEFVPPFAPSSCLCQHIPGLHSETVSCHVIPSELPSKLSWMVSWGSPCSHEEAGTVNGFEIFHFCVSPAKVKFP